MPRLFGADGRARQADGDRPGLPEHQHLQLVRCWWQGEHFTFLEFFGSACLLGAVSLWLRLPLEAPCGLTLHPPATGEG